jgi:hypothetical protein
MSEQNILIEGRVTYDKSAGPVGNATVGLYHKMPREVSPTDLPEVSATTGGESAMPPAIAHARTNPNGDFEIRASVDPGDYVVRCTAFGATATDCDLMVHARPQDYKALLDMKLDLKVSFLHYSETNGDAIPDTYAVVGRPIVARLESCVEDHIGSSQWQDNSAARITRTGKREAVVVPLQPERLRIAAKIIDKGEHGGAMATLSEEVAVVEEVETVGVRGDIGVGGHIRVTMERPDARPTLDEALWSAIDERCEAIGFHRYQAHIRRVFELPNVGSFQSEISRKLSDLGARGVGVYRVLRDVTELFVLSGCGPLADRKSHEDPIVRDFGPQWQRSREEIEEGLRLYLHNGELPYIERVVNAAYPWLNVDGSGLDALRRRVLRQPLFLELWHEMCLEHGMLMRTMDAVCARFQNIYNRGENDGLASYEISPLWPLGDLLWDWSNHEPTRLNPKRRIQEYVHQYGPSTLDRNILGARVADVRTAFPGAFMNLLNLCEEFYKEDNQTTVIADAFPTLVALREVHQILAMGAGNAAPQLTFAARVETLMMQLMLAQPELRAFLRVREMVPYDEAWMGQVDAMKDLQGWQDQSISYYRDLAVYGERILLSVRLGDWTVGHEDNAKHWARRHKHAIRRVIHAYRAISGGELAASNRRPPARAALIGDGRTGMLRGRQQPRPELSFAENPGRITPQLTSRGRLID